MKHLQPQNGHQGQVFSLLYVHNFFGLKRPQFSSKIFFFSRSRSSIATKYCLSAASNAGLFAESVFKIFILKFWISIKSKYAASYGSTTVYAPSKNHYLCLSRLFTFIVALLFFCGQPLKLFIMLFYLE
jgi:hypothetical protein